MSYLGTAVNAARAAGAIQRENFGKTLNVDEAVQHDVKLEVDKLCEHTIIDMLAAAFPDHAILGEEGGAVGEHSHRWIIDPLDGTVNFFHNIPHFCVSIALEVEGVSTVGVIYDPLLDEMFCCEKGRGAFLNDQPIHVSPVIDPAEAIIVTGFMKSDRTIRAGLDGLEKVIHKVRKVRCTGSAALDLAYVAAGRFAAYYETGIRHWDIAAGKALVECAGGRFEVLDLGDERYNVHASNGHTHAALTDCFPLDVQV